MSRRTSSGSRFANLPVEGEDDQNGSDSSVYEMKLSRDYYPAVVPLSQGDRGSTHSSDSSVREMTLSRDNYPAAIPIGQEQLQETENLSRYLPATPGAGTSGIQSSRTIPIGRDRSDFRSSDQKHISSRPIIPKGVSREKSSDLDFNWDHFRRESFDDMGVDALDNLFKTSKSSDSSSQTDISKNIEEDVRVLTDIGFCIEYPHGMLGEGFYGVVYRGRYGTSAPKVASNMFAVKVIEFGTDRDRDTLERRERMIINMGEVRSYPFTDNPSQRFLSPERVYLIMDFADGGELELWITRNSKSIEPSLRIDLIRDLFYGMQYLHSESIVHGDVHTGNVLMFHMEGRWLAKWSDFGLGFVGKDKQYQYRIPKSVPMYQLFRADIAGVCSVFGTIMRGRHLCRPETPDEKNHLNRILDMITMMRDIQVTSLNQVYQQFRHLLEDELNFDEQHFQ